MRWLRNLLAVLRPGRRIVGTDLDGNTYIEVTSSSKLRREVVTKLKHEEYKDGSIPVEWESWIRRKRNDPPTHDELIKNMQQRETIRERARHLEQEEREKLKELKDVQGSLLSTSPIGHASARVYKKLDLESEPTRTGDTFQPGAWTPNQGGKGQTGTSQQKETEEDNADFQPGAWSPPKTNK